MCVSKKSQVYADAHIYFLIFIHTPARVFVCNYICVCLYMYTRTQTLA